MELNREEVISKLETAMVAVTSQPTIEQSNTFVFAEGQLITFDGEIYTEQESPFGKEIEGSIIAIDFLKMLQKFPDETVKIEQKKDELLLRGRNRKAGIIMNAEILLPYKDVPKPSEFKTIAKGLMPVLRQAASACGKDETIPKTTHVHIAKDRVEATDSFRLFRADIKTGLPASFMIHAVNVIEICRQSIEKVCPSKEGWIHFLCTNEMVVSVLCSEEKYYKKQMMDELLEVKGKKVKLPEDLLDVLGRAGIMDTPSLSTGGWDSQVTLKLAEGVLEVTSQKEEGWFKEKKKLKYKGPEMVFTIYPTFLKELLEKTDTVIINDRQIKIEVDNIHYTASLETA